MSFNPPSKGSKFSFFQRWGGVHFFPLYSRHEQLEAISHFRVLKFISTHTVIFGIKSVSQIKIFVCFFKRKHLGIIISLETHISYLFLSLLFIEVAKYIKLRQIENFKYTITSGHLVSKTISRINRYPSKSKTDKWVTHKSTKKL